MVRNDCTSYLGQNPLATPNSLSHASATAKDFIMPDTPLTQFLTPLARLAERFPAVEGAVVWAAQDDATELLDAEEIAFYAEGLLLEGFGMMWQAMADAATPKEPDHILLMFWQGPAAAPPPPPQEGWVIMAQGAWAAQSATAPADAPVVAPAVGK